MSIKKLKNSIYVLNLMLSINKLEKYLTEHEIEAINTAVDVMKSLVDSKEEAWDY